MTIQKQQPSIHERIFNEKTIRRASTMYRNYIDVRLDELHEAKRAGKGTSALLIQADLYRLSKNLNEMEQFEMKLASEIATKPVQASRPVEKKQRKSPDAKKALATFNGYVDVYLDVLSSAIRQGDTQRAEEVKTELASLRESIAEMEGVRN